MWFRSYSYSAWLSGPSGRQGCAIKFTNRLKDKEKSREWSNIEKTHRKRSWSAESYKGKKKSKAKQREAKRSKAATHCTTKHRSAPPPQSNATQCNAASPHMNQVNQHEQSEPACEPSEPAY